ncbi:LPXTG cell wall anchor domain-containing protein [Streptomyces sp. V3I7]|uniref:LPXTG cell wall anchor domain-containing protein n=1 Tax=Streptomyces sp. V3I7 TaxID=3042278 RepID=UPI0027D8188E|nr:LPXTG cell wall anchor domain-containing protein [Streptomyces sp. V3I7]
MRTLLRAGALSAGLSAVLLVAPSAHATAPGDNGTVKIHDAKTGEDLRRNEPHVCTFYLDAFGFDGAQQVDWHIEAWAPTGAEKGATVKSGSLALDAGGHARTADLSLPDGHYKLFWNFDGEHGAAKHKVFWTDCQGSKAGDVSVSVSASASVGAGGVAVGAGASVGADASASAAPSASASAAPSAQGGSGDLAETGNGAPVALLSTLAAAMVGAGGFLLLRRRKAAGN